MRKIAIILLITFTLSLEAVCLADSYDLNTPSGYQTVKAQSLCHNTGTGSSGK